ncbi:MAG: M23 family metallopeptidase [Clostridia bacterium]|nr:M23 family metallopeptidase [Clostridia bacterium]
MKFYSNSTNDKKKKNNLWTLVGGLALIVSAVIITVVATLPDNSQNVGGNIIPPVGEQAEQYVMPMSEYTMGQEFSDKLVFNQTLKQWRTHNGVDFIGEKGADVRAVLGGKVTSVETTTLEGTVVTIEQSDGIVSIYKSLSAEVAVEVGQTVKAGDLIGKVDATMVTEKNEGTHLHLEMKKDGQYVNPLEYLPEGADK